MSQPDPFLQVQEDVLSSLTTLRTLFSSHNRIRTLAKSASSNPELAQSRADLTTTLSDLSADLDDLSQSVRAIEHDPYRYGIELDELERRREFLKEARGEVEGVWGELERQDAQMQMQMREEEMGDAQAGLPSPSHFDDFDDEEQRGGAGGAGGEDYYAQLEQERQVEMMAEQDQQLEGVFRTVGNLRAQADDMGRELEEQAVLIENVDSLADRVGGKLKTGARRLQHVIAKNEDTASSCCIAVLIFVLILLLVLLIIL